MKRTLALVLSVFMLMSLAACGGTAAPAVESAEPVVEETPAAESAAPTAEETPAVDETPAAEPVDVNILALKGPTAMGMVKMMDDADNGALTDNNYHFEITATVDEVGPALIQGKADIAALPANLASVLYNKTEGGLAVLAVNTLGVLYIVDHGEQVKTVSDLAGLTVYASGKGATPEFALNYILKSNGIDPDTDVNIEWKSEHAECLAAFLENESSVAMLPQPFVTTAMMKNEGVNVALSLTDEWDAIQQRDGGSSSLLTGVCVVRKAFLEEHPEAVEAFLAHYAQSVDFVNSDTASAAALVAKYDIVPEPVALKALPECNIVCMTGAEMKAALSGYLQVLFDSNAAAVGGQLPGDEFYYGA